MNLILLHPDDLLAPNKALLRGRRSDHILHVHNAKIGTELRVGMVDGLLGVGEVVAISDQGVTLQFVLSHAPPPPLQVTLVLALPRPKMLKRILQSVTALGVKRIYLINSYRVDKSFWGSSLLSPENLRQQFELGLEQAVDTVFPQLYFSPRFKPFIEDELPAIAQGTSAYVAHPGVTGSCESQHQQPVTIAIGPEGGFIPYEIDKFRQCGFSPIQLGERILRVETAVPVLLSRFI